MSVEYLLSVMRDESAEVHRRDQAARDAAPYCHAKLLAMGARNSDAPASDLFVTQIVVTPVPSGHDASGKPFDFGANRPRVVTPLLEAVEIVELDEEPESEAAEGPKPTGLDRP